MACPSPNLSRPRAVATRELSLLSPRHQPRSTGRRVPWGFKKYPREIFLTHIKAPLWHWLGCSEKSQKSTDQAILERRIILVRLVFFVHPAFALAPYKCDYFTSFTQGTDGPPTPTVETFFDLEKPNPATYPFTVSKKISSPCTHVGKNIHLTDRLKLSNSKDWNQ